MNVAPAPVMLAAILSPASAGAFAPGALASPVCAWLPDGWHAATNSSVDSASAVVRKMDVFMWAPWGGASRLLGSAHGLMFLLHLDDSAVANGTQWPQSAKWRRARAPSPPPFPHVAAACCDFPACGALCTMPLP